MAEYILAKDEMGVRFPLPAFHKSDYLHPGLRQVQILLLKRSKRQKPNCLLDKKPSRCYIGMVKNYLLLLFVAFLFVVLFLVTFLFLVVLFFLAISFPPAGGLKIKKIE